ncbi:MAG: glycoside hydrolase TIM-barrel-like domain-containing protein, partial [Caulobacterales bacterium]|nr:glycoside hydrolase TIM-barrel-like domain-containing protein [Caulobacterales bacterium]
EDLPLAEFGNRAPQFNFEVYRAPAPASGAPTLESQARAVTLIPGSGEFAYGTTTVARDLGPGVEEAENVNNTRGVADISAALDDLQARLPGVTSVMIVCSWFGDDLRCGSCRLRPGVESDDKITRPYSWRVGPVDREAAYLISTTDEVVNYGGTPADLSILEAIAEVKARGLKVGLYPFILMDVPADNTLADPYGGAAQAPFPWRGRITCDPAPGEAGTPDKTAGATAQINAFFGTASSSDFAAVSGTIAYLGPAEDSFRRFILHHAHLSALAGGVDAFIMGSEMVGLTTVRDGPGSYPAVAQLVALADEVRSVIGPAPVLTYAADWTEYFGHQPRDGSGDVYFHLDPLWSSADIDVIGIDWYAPLSDWRDGLGHADAAGHSSIYDPAYLASNVEGGEGFDWFYASPADRDAQLRTPIT